MKTFKAFIFVCLFLFSIIGCIGYTIYVKEPQFAVGIFLLGIWVALDFFGVTTLPKKKDLF